MAYKIPRKNGNVLMERKQELDSEKGHKDAIKTQFMAQMKIRPNYVDAKHDYDVTVILVWRTSLDRTRKCPRSAAATVSTTSQFINDFRSRGDNVLLFPTCPR